MACIYTRTKIRVRMRSLFLVDRLLRSSLWTACLLTVLILGLVRPQSVHGQAAEADSTIQVMLLGTVHLDNPGRDINNPSVPDVLTSQKQRELSALHDSLAQFQPTKMAIEVRRQHQAALDSLYQAFRGGQLDTSFAVGDFTSPRSEQYQLGFRLADRLGHDRVWAIDHFIPMQIRRVQSHAQENDPALLQYLQDFSQGPLMTTIDSLLQHGTLPEVYRFLNRPETVERFHAPNVRMAAAVAETSTDTSYVGADVIAAYHKRNLRIFANLASVAEPGDRIIAIFGAGHMPYLRPLIQASPQFEFVDPRSYL